MNKTNFMYYLKFFILKISKLFGFMISGSQTRLRLEQTISLGRLDRLDSTYTTDSIHIQVD